MKPKKPSKPFAKKPFVLIKNPSPTKIFDYYRVFGYELPLTQPQKPIEEFLSNDDYSAHTAYQALRSRGLFATIHGSDNQTNWSSVTYDQSATDLPF